MSGSDLVEAPGRTLGFQNRMPGLAVPRVPPTRVSRLVLTMAVLALGLFGGFGTWAALAPLSSAVVAAGQFKVPGDVLVVQHLEGGIVSQIDVREGQLVSKGDALILLDGTRSNAQIGILVSQLASALARDLRLRAEILGSETLVPSKELKELIAAYPHLKTTLEAQQDALTANRELAKGQLRILQERGDQYREQIKGLRARGAALAGQLNLVRDEIKLLDQLFSKALTTLDRVTQRKRDEMALLGDIGENEAKIQDGLQQVSEIKQRMLQVRVERMKEIADERRALQDEIRDTRERISAITDIQDRLTITAPASGYVKDLKVNTIGEVIAPGQKVLEIVPNHTSYVIEAHVSPKDIDEVHLNGPARVRLSAYSYRTTPLVPGIITHVSADSFDGGTGGRPYYKVNVTVQEKDLAAITKVHVVPGMPAQVMLETGKQTLVTYLLDPIIGGFEVALKEKE